MSTDELSVIMVEGDTLTVTIEEDVLIVTVTEVIDLGAGTYDHSVLINRDIADQHSMTAISGLLAALLDKEDTGVAATLDANHVIAADPHTVYVLESEIDAIVDASVTSNAWVALNTTHRTSDGKDHSDVVLNNTHRGSDGKDHSDVVLNNTHRGSDGSDHSLIAANTAHAAGDGSDHADVATNTTHTTSDGKDHSDVVLNNTHRGSTGADHTYIDQDVTPTATPTFAGMKLTPTDVETTVKGQMRYGDTDPSVYVNDGSIELDAIFGKPIRITNINGTAITKGQVVNIIDASLDLPAVELALATNTDESGFVPGLVLSDSIADTESGYVMALGIVDDLDTSTFAAGAEVYLSATVAGGLVATEPELPNKLIRIGIVTYVHADDGKIFVAPQLEPDKLYDLRMIAKDRQEPNGFIRNQPTTTGDISFVNGTRTFTIQPQGGESSFVVYCGGQRFVKTAPESFVADNTEGIKVFYYDLDGVLHHTTSVTDAIITLYTFVAIIYWSVADAKAILLGDERHGIQMDGTTHLYTHRAESTKYESGLNIDGLSDGGAGYTQTTSGDIWDQDINHSIALQTTHKFWYKDGANGYWKETTADSLLSHDGGGNAYWNEWTGATWQLTAMSGSQYSIVHFLATNDINYPIVKITGQSVYANRAAARNAIATEIADIAYDGLPAAEFVFLYSIIITSGGLLESNSDGSLFTDFRGAILSGAPGASGATSYHADLLDTATDGHPVSVITGLTHKESFGNVDLTAGVLTVTHNLNSEFPSSVIVWDNNSLIISPDDIESTGVNTLTVDLSSYGTITGTWNVSIII